MDDGSQICLNAEQPLKASDQIDTTETGTAI